MLAEVPVFSNGDTVVKTFRISKRIYTKLQAEAKAMGLTTNALLSMIMTRYVEWDRLSRRFGEITLFRDTFKLILGAMDEKQLIETVQTLSTKQVREAYMFWFGNVSIETYLKWLKMKCTYAGLAECECQVNGKDYTIILHHDLGKKHSIWLRYGHDATLKSLLNINAQFEVSDNAVTIRFRAPPASSQFKAYSPAK